MKTRPCVSIIVPAFNLENYIDKTLESIVQQTFLDWEALVIDDDSSDNTSKIIKRWTLRDERIRFLRNQKSKGPSGARNTGIDNARGQWVAFLDGDDMFERNALESRIEAAKANPSCRFISGDFKNLSEGDTSGKPFSETNVYWRECLHGDGDLQTAPRLIYDPIQLFLKASLTCTDCVMVHTQLLRDLSGFNESFKTAEDNHLWMRLAASVDNMLFVPKSMAYYRKRADSLTQQDRAVHKNSIATYRNLLADPLFLDKKEDLLRSIRRFSHSNSFHYRQQGEKLLAIYSAVQGVRWDLYSSTSWKNLVASLLLR